MTEEERYATIQQQMKELSDRAAEYKNPAISLLSAQLYAEMYTRNERHHQRVMDARRELVRVLQMRIDTIISIAWQTEVMPAPAFSYFHAQCLARHTFKSEAIAHGKRRELLAKDMGSNAKCSHCYGSLREPPPVIQ